MQLEDRLAHHDGVAGIVATLIAHHQVRSLGEVVCDLALALIAPLGADDDRRWHGQPPVMLSRSVRETGKGVSLQRICCRREDAPVSSVLDAASIACASQGRNRAQTQAI